MKNKLYLRSLFRDIRDTLGRFVAIILIIFMAVLLFVGIKSVGPDLEQTVDEFVSQKNISDVQIIGTAGLTEEDQAIAEETGATAELGYSFAYDDEEENIDLQVYSYDETSSQNNLSLIEGRLPKAANELVLNESLAEIYPLGSTLMIQNDQLEETEFQVVGFVESPIYVSENEFGSSNVGDGTLDGYAYLSEDAFSAGDTYSIMYLRFDSLAELDIFSDDYQEKLTAKLNQLETTFANRKSERRAELIASGNDEIAANQASLDQSQSELTAGQTQLDDAKQQLEIQKSQLVATASLQSQSSYEAALAQITTAETELSTQQTTLTENQQTIDEAQAEIDQAKTDLENLSTPNYLINERTSNPGFEEVTSLSDRIDAIGNVFPVFFFLIAALITFTTITRMVEEDRKIIGTLKAVGYTNIEISMKYILYALLTAVVGTVLGIFVGTFSLPALVFNMLGASYVFTDYTITFWLGPILIAIGGSFVATVVATIYILIKDLREKPTALLMPKAPKPGKRILLEYIKPVWRRLSFNQKVTYRNLFRYKARMILTIAGIAGCCGLMLAGFGLRDSIENVGTVQFNQLNHFQGIVTLDSEISADAASQTLDVLDSTAAVTKETPVYASQVTFKADGVADQSASLYAFETSAAARANFTLQSTSSDSSSELVGDGAIISEGLAKAYEVKVGDDLVFQDANGNQMTLKISGIVENYLGNNVLLLQSYLEQLTDQSHQVNSFLIQTTEMSKSSQDDLAAELKGTDQVLTTTFMSQQLEKQAYSSTNLQPVVIIFIVLSGTLALVVLFNLTNINVSERERELATIKVLGFYDQEVSMYIVRESIIFTGLGILLGFVVGNVLTWFIITMAASPSISFPLLVPAIGYLFPAGLTIFFSAVVMLITHQRLKKIDMIGALKSNE
ncbi:FtsX-like permease family protein [Enterococcus sp. LJL120]